MWRLQCVSLGVMAWAAAILPTMADNAAPALVKSVPAAMPSAEAQVLAAQSRPLAAVLPVQAMPRDPRLPVARNHGDDQAESARPPAIAPTPQIRDLDRQGRYAAEVGPDFRRGRAESRDWPLSAVRTYRAPRDAFGGRWIYVRPASRSGYAGRGRFDNNRYRHAFRSEPRGPYGARYRDDERYDRSYSPRAQRSYPHHNAPPYDRRASGGEADDGNWDRYPYNVGRRRDF